MQSASDRSPAPNSLLTGNLTGNSSVFSSLSRFFLGIDVQLQWFVKTFPKQQNRELIRASRESSLSEQGTLGSQKFWSSWPAQAAFLDGRRRSNKTQGACCGADCPEPHRALH